MSIILLLLSLAFMAIIVDIVIRIIRNQKCLDNELIGGFMSNRLSENERDRVIIHLGTCKKCQQKLHEYNFGKDIEDHLIDSNQDK